MWVENKPFLAVIFILASIPSIICEQNDPNDLLSYDEPENIKDGSDTTALYMEYPKVTDIQELLHKQSEAYLNTQRKLHQAEGKPLYVYQSDLMGTSYPDISEENLELIKENAYLECLRCYAHIDSEVTDPCYTGAKLHTEACPDTAQCYTEINPLYIKRGCSAPDSLNKTFVCKCPYCNDRPSSDMSYYTYKDLTDWEFDNFRLSTPCTQTSYIYCKNCSAQNDSSIEDKNCREGKNMNELLCDVNEICFTNIDGVLGSVNRGCIRKPVFNSFFYFCDSPLCNNQTEDHPYLRENKGNNFVKALYKNLRLPKNVTTAKSGTTQAISQILLLYCLETLIFYIFLQTSVV